MFELASQFFAFDRFLAARAIGSGRINDTYHIDFELAGEKKTALLQRLNHEVFSQPGIVMANTLRVCQYLEKQDYPYQIAAPIPALDGEYLKMDERGNYWRAFPYIAHSFSPEGLADAHIAYEAAKAYGAFARALRDFPCESLAETILGFHDTDLRWQRFLRVLENDPRQRSHSVKPEIEAIFKAKPVFEKISQLKNSGLLPLRVSHNDTKSGNVLFDKTTRKPLAVIDLDTVMPGTLLSDFGDMLRTFAPSCGEDATEAPTLRQELTEALLTGYLEETQGFLTETERKHLMLGAAWMTGEQALRFLTDFLEGDVYYKISSPEQNLARARNQLALLKTMEDFSV